MLLLLFPTQRNWRKTVWEHSVSIVKGRNSFSSLLACGLEPRDNSVLFVQSDVTISLFCSVECLPLWIGLDFGKQHQYQSPSTHAPIQRQNRKAWQQGGCVCQPAGSSFLPSLNDRRYHDVQRNAYYSVRILKTDVPVGEDQIQHVEVARDIIDHFNRKYDVHFNLPEPEVFVGRIGFGVWNRPPNHVAFGWEKEDEQIIADPI